MDVDLNSGVLGIPLAPVNATPFSLLWCLSWWKTLWEARRHHGRICSVHRPSPHHLVPVVVWEWDGIRDCWGILFAHGHRCDHGEGIYEGDGVEGARMAWLIMDDDMDDSVGLIHDGRMGSSARHGLMASDYFSDWTPTGKNSRRRLHRTLGHVAIASASFVEMSIEGYIGS